MTPFPDDRAYEELLDEIVAGRLAPGAEVDAETVAERLDVPLPAARDAQRRLADDGLLDHDGGPAPRVVGVDLRRTLQAFQVFAALHALAARLAVPHMGFDDLASMRDADASRVAALRAGDVAGAIDADDRFHGALVDAADNPDLALALRRLQPKIRRLDLVHGAGLDSPDGEHEAIVGACERGDADEAAALVEVDFLRAGRRVVASIERTAG